MKEDVKLPGRRKGIEMWKKQEKCEHYFTIQEIKKTFLYFSMRQNRSRMQQEAQRDAPDPRETRPPCYSDAILMPRLDGSFASLNELNSNRGKNKRRRLKTEEQEDDEHDEEVPLRRNRCRSEEVLSMRETVRGSVRPSRLVPRTHPLEIEPIDRNRSSNEDEEVEQVSTSIKTLEHSPGPSRRKPFKASIQPIGKNNNEIEIFNRSNNSLERSPYAKRKLNHMNNRSTAPGSSQTVSKPLLSQSNSLLVPSSSIEIIDNHFDSDEQKSSNDSGSECSDEFITIKVEKQSSNSSSNEDGLVVLRKPSNI